MTRTTILATMLRLASDQGLANVSLSHLASACSITKATLFHHFKSRDALIDELFAYASALAQRQMVTIALGGSAREVLGSAMDHWHELYATEPLTFFFRIVESESLHSSAAMRLKQSHHQMIVAQSRAILERLSSTGRLAIGDLELATLLFSSTAAHLLWRLLSEDEDAVAWEEDAFIASFVRLYDPALH